MRPDPADWPAALRANRSLVTGMPWMTTPAHGDVDRVGTDRQDSRRELLEAAQAYTRDLIQQAHACDIEVAPAPTTVDATAPLVLTGHQPVVFHPGLEWKYYATARFARAEQATSVAVVMDLDPGDAGIFLVPRPDPVASAVAADAPPPLATVERSLAVEATGLFATARLASRDRIETITREVVDGLEASGRSRAAERSARTLGAYARLAGMPVVEANAIAQLAEDRLHVQWLLPFSRMMRLDPYRHAMGWLLDDAPRLHSTYNQLLEAYRTEHGLRGQVNPFPNLGERGDLRELPFWRIDHGRSTRDAVWFRETPAGPQFVADGESLPACPRGQASAWLASTVPAGQQIVPRGALVSLLFRCVACDLFVHGTGGGTYDPFTDRLISGYVGVEPPRFAVASGTRHLFDSWPERLASLDELAAQARDVLHHPECYFGRGWFAEDVEQRLRVLVEAKQATVAELKAARQAGEPGAAMGRRLEELATEMKRLVDGQLAPKLDVRLRISEATRATLLERRWPWFYFPAIEESPGFGP